VAGGVSADRGLVTGIYSKAIALCRAFERFAESLYGCAHRQKGFPITVGRQASVAGQQGEQAETYVVCLDCGRHLAYDWTTMQVTDHRASAKTTTPRFQ
jgi:hypothetical protein